MLNTNQEPEAISNAHSHRHALRLIALGVLVAAIIATLLAYAGLLTTVDVAHAQNQTQAQGWEGPASSASSEVASAQAQGQVLITFDNIPIGATISNQYPQAMFSSDASNATVASDHFFGTSLPNLSRRNLSSWNCCSGYAPLVVDFPNPVNDLAFHILAADNFGTIAWVEVYQNNVWTTTQPVTGFGNPFSPIWYTGLSGYKNVSRIRITAISDINGLAFDNFSFTIAPTPTPTPLPSPTPTPPPAPTNVNATPDENEIKLSWTPSAGAASYVIKRTETIFQSNEMAAATEAGSAFAAIASSVSCQPVNGRCFYEDTACVRCNRNGLTGFDVQYWNGSTWVTVTGGNVTGNYNVWKKFTFAPISTSKIRVLINASPDGYSRLTEVEAWGSTTPPRTNVALASNGGMASSSSNYSDGTYNYTPEGANNGVRSGSPSVPGEAWNGATSTFPQWLQVDFNGSKTIGEIDVFTVQDNWENPVEPTETMTFSLYGLTAFDVQYWSGSSWVTVPGGSVSGNNKVWTKITFAAITTTKIRVLAHASADGYSRITEVEAWGTAAAQ